MELDSPSLSAGYYTGKALTGLPVAPMGFFDDYELPVW